MLAADGRAFRWRLACIALVVFVLLGTGRLAIGQGGDNEPPFEFVSIEFETLLGDVDLFERPEIPEKSVIEGDRVRISAEIQNRSGSPTEEFVVRFYFEGQISRETGKIADEIIHRLDDGESLRTSVVWDTTDLRPGTYTIIADANPSGAEEIEGYGSLTVLREGLYIDFLGPIQFPHKEPLCPTGRILTELHFMNQDFVNLGTVPIGQGDLDIMVSYRGDKTQTYVEMASSPLAATLWRMEDGQEVFLTDKLLTGETGRVRFQTRYDFDLANDVLRLDQPDSLGFGNPIRIKFEAIANSKTASSPTYVPSKKDFLTVYSKLDLWTFPSRSGCGGTAIESQTIGVPPVIEGGKIFFVVSSASGSGEVSHKLYSATTTTGTARWSRPVVFDSRVTPPAVGRRGTNTVVYVGSSKPENSLYAIVDIDLGAGADPPAEANRDTGFPKPGVAPQIGSVLYQPAVRTDLDSQGSGRDIVYVGSENGLFALNGDGSLRWKITEPGEVTQPVTAVPDTDDVWFASGKFIYRVEDPGNKNGAELEQGDYSFFPVDSSIATALVATGQAADYDVFFCTEESSVYAVGLSDDDIVSSARKSKIEAEYVHGLSVVGEPASSASIYAYTELGIHLLTYDNGEYLQDAIRYDISQVGELVPARTPAVLLDNSQGFRALLITTNDGELLALSEDLDDVLNIEIWDNKDAEFRFAAPSPTMTRPVVASDFNVVVVGTAEDGYVYAFEFSDE